MKYYTNLHSFYCSKEWENLKRLIVSQRLNENGEVIDEYTGKPIYKKYDMVFHHKIELTLANVNDANISLNPDNIMIVSHKSHNEIHNRFGFNAKKVVLVYGNACSGKSTLVKELATKNDIVLDMDNIWEMVSNNARYDRPDTLKAVVFAIRTCLLEQIKSRNGKWFYAYVINGSPYAMERKRLIENLGVDDVIHVDTDKDTCLQRLYDNPDGRNIELWTKYINEYDEAFQHDE